MIYQDDRVASSNREMGVSIDRPLFRFDSEVYRCVFIPQLHYTYYFLGRLSQT